ncbi:MAG: PIN domain-containing protein [Planctomycetaceae bacterium]
MPGRVLDTSVLINHWRRSRTSWPNARETRDWALRLVDVRQTNLIFSPVYLEFNCGVQSAEELALAEAFLSVFEVKDGWDVRSDDLQEAARLARRVPRDGKRRQFADCLIRALAIRFRCEVLSDDRTFPRH